MHAPKLVGETTITGKNQVSLPAEVMRRLRWKRGDHLLAEVLGEDILLLIRRPERWTEAFAGRLTDVFGTHEDMLRWLEEERQSWDHEPPRVDH